MKMSEQEESVETFIKIGMPIAAGGTIFLLTAMGLTLVMDKYIFSLDLGSPTIIKVGFGSILLASFYCFGYARNKQGYFGSKEKWMRHFTLLIALPIFLGTALAFQSYQAKMVSYKSLHRTEELKSQDK
jgi:hypothetical protein